MALLRVEKIAKYEIPADLGTDMVGGVVSLGGATFNTASRWPTENCVNIDDDGEFFSLPLTGVSGTTIIMCGNFWIDARTSTQGETVDELLTLTNNAAVAHFGVHINYNGQIILVRTGGAGTIVKRSAPGILKYRRWHHIEIKGVAANLPSGSIIVKLDGVEIFNESGFDTLAGAVNATDQARFWGADDHVRWMDCIVMDGSGSAPFNDFLDDYRIEAAAADADGGTAAWTPNGAGTNIACINHAVGSDDEDTTYIESSTNNQVNLASHANVSLPNVASILGVQVELLARTTGTGSLRAQATGGATATGPTRTLSTAYQWHVGMFLVDPDTAAAWANAAAINGTEFGVELIS